MVYGAATGTARLNAAAPHTTYRKQRAELPYCSAGTKVPDQIQNEGQYQYPCQYRDEDFVVPQPVERDALFITTRVKEHNETLPPGCNAQTHAEE